MGIRQRRDALDRMAKVGPKAAAAARTTTVDEPPPLLSVTSVAEMIGVSKGELRAVVQRPEFIERIRFRKPGADGQAGRSLLIPRDLVEELRTIAKSCDVESEPENAGESQRQEWSEQAGSEPQMRSDSANPQMSVAIVYERLLAEKDSRIADLRAEIEHLRGVLEREQTGHARAQALLSLQAPPPPIESEPEAPAPEPEAAYREEVTDASRTDVAAEPHVTAASATDSDEPQILPVSEPALGLEPTQLVETNTSSPMPAAKKPFWKFWG